MQIHRGLLQQASEQGLISAQQVQPLWDFFSEHERRQAHQQPGFRATHILYYLGGMIAIGAMSLFMNLGWERFGGWGLFAIALSYGAIALGLTEYLLRASSRGQLQIPAGITACLVVVLTPLLVYGLQVGLGLWSEQGRLSYRDYHTRVDWRWLLMELATLASGAVLLWRYRLPFLVMPVAVTLWYLSMDLTPFVFNDQDQSWDLRKLVSLWFGLLIVLLAFWVDVRSRRNERDYAFWLYLFGVIAFWGGLSLQQSDSELSKFFYLCINLGLIAVGAMLSRRVFAVFGGLGAALYLGHLAHGLFRDSLLFPLVLTLIGLGLVGLGILWQRHEACISARLRGWLPEALRELVERRG